MLPTLCARRCPDDKAIQNQRVTLVEGEAAEVAVIRRIFHEFVKLGYSEYRIAE